MAEQPHSQDSLLRRAVFSFVRRLSSLSLGVFALGMVAFILVAPKCPGVEPEFTVTPSDVHGKLEYCIAEVQYGGRPTSPRLKVSAASECSQDKAALAERAQAMMAKAAADIAACNRAMMTEPHLVVWRRIQGWLTAA